MAKVISFGLAPREVRGPLEGDDDFDLQPRLRLGPFELVPVPGKLVWAWPGGGVRSIGECVRLAHARGWPLPTVIRVSVRRRAEEGGPHD